MWWNLSQDYVGRPLCLSLSLFPEDRLTAYPCHMSPNMDSTSTTHAIDSVGDTLSLRRNNRFDRLRFVVIHHRQWYACTYVALIDSCICLVRECIDESACASGVDSAIKLVGVNQNSIDHRRCLLFLHVQSRPLLAVTNSNALPVDFPLRSDQECAKNDLEVFAAILAERLSIDPDALWMMVQLNVRLEFI